MKGKLEILEHAQGDETLDAALDAILSAQGAEHGVVFSRRDVRLEARIGGALAGGISAKLGRSFMYVELLAVEPGHRGQGVGRALMARAEAVAREAGARGVWVDTFTFQAPGFYERVGYDEVGRIADYVGGHDRVFYAKRFDEAGGDDDG